MVDKLNFNQFTQLNEPFNHISSILKKKIAITYIKNENEWSTFTYEDLRKQCEKVEAILDTNIMPSQAVSIVGIYCNSEHAALVCMLAISTKRPFMYLSTELKEPELRNLIKRVPISILITDKALYNKCKESGFVAIKEFNIFSNSFFLMNLVVAKYNDDDVPELSLMCSLAYVMCTSGSTGSPKLVYVPHKCIVPNIKDLKNIFSVSSRDTILNVSPLSFDPSIVNIFLSLNYGAHLIMVAPELVKRPKSLEVVLKDNRISIIEITPSLMKSFSSSFLRGYFSSNKSLRIVAFGGEAFPSPFQCKEWFTPDSQIKVFNLYGLTEMSCWASCHQVDICKYILKNEDTASVPLGMPLTGTTLYLIDDSGYEVTKGMTGNIIIGGERNVCAIVEGKISHHKLINKDIVTGDIGYTDGTNIFYVDRIFNSIKRNGCKIGLTEVEGTLKLLPEVYECCTVFYNNAIYLFVVQSQFASLDEQFLWAHLEKTLSAWKMPNKIFIIEKLPINRNGKVDKLSLIEKAQSMTIEKTQSMTIEKTQDITNYFSTISNQNDENFFETMGELWRNQLKGCVPKKLDNFVNLGGNSIKAIALAEEIKEKFAVETPLILQTILNDCFEDVCKLVKDSKNPSFPDTNRGSSLSGLNLKRKINDLESISLSSRSFSCYVTRGGSHNIQKMARVCRDITAIKVVWKVCLDKCIDASPLLIEQNKQARLLIGSHSHKFMCVDENGLTIWTTELPDRIEGSAAASHDGQAVYVGCYDGNLYCLNVTKGEVLWKVTTDGIIKSSPAVHLGTGLIIFGSYDKNLYCCNCKGKFQWKKMISNGSIFSSPAIGETHVYVATLDGYVVCLDLKGNRKWKKIIGKPIFSSIALFASGLAFGCTDHFIYCLNYDSEILWKYKTGGPIFSSPFILQRESSVLISIGSHDNHLYLFDHTGALISSTKLNSPIFSTPFMVMYEEFVCYTFLCETKGEIHVLKLQLNYMNRNYDLIGKYKIDGEIFSSPVFYKNKLYVGCRDNNFYCLSVS